MAENVSPETPASEPAELTIEEVAAMRVARAEKDADEQQEQPQDNEQNADTEQQADEPEAEQEQADTELQEDASEEDAQPEAKDDVLIKMDDGSTITVADLKAQASTLKTENARISQEVANERRELQESGKNFADAMDRISAWLESTLPQAPDDTLLWSNPTKHHQMTHLRNAAMNELQAVLHVKKFVDDGVGKISEAETRAYQAEQKAALIAAVPNLKDEKRFEAAMGKTRAYLKTVGFEQGLIDSTHDAKMLQVAMDAAYGKEAREAAAKVKVQIKSPVATKPAVRTVHQNSMTALNVQNAQRKAAKTGSIDDVLAMRMARLK